MKEALSSRSYFLFGGLCMIYYYCYSQDHISVSEISRISHRALINRIDTCSGETCSNLYFLSGILDVVSLDLRFTKPTEEKDFKPVFEDASFTEAAVSSVSPFSALDFVLTSDTSESSAKNIGGSYAFSHVTNGSAIVVASEYPGREIWMFSDSSLASSCSADISSAIVFSNALNDGSDVFTMTPDGDCEKLEMDPTVSSPLTYCQTASNFTWNVYQEFECSTNPVVSGTVEGSLGTVYCVVVGEGLNSAEFICLSSESSFVIVDPDKGDDSGLPQFLRRNMQVIGGSAAAVVVVTILLVLAVHWLRSPSLVSFREGDIVIYRLTRQQRKHLMLKRKAKGKKKGTGKTMGFALVVRAPPPSTAVSLLLSLLPSRSRRPLPAAADPRSKAVLQLQPLKRVVRGSEPEDDLFAPSDSLDRADESVTASGSMALKRARSVIRDDDFEVELSVDSKERPVSSNWWGIRGGRVLCVLPNVARRPLAPPPPREDGSEDGNEFTIGFLDSIDTEQLLCPVRVPSIRRRSVITREKTKEKVEDRRRKKLSASESIWLSFSGGMQSIKGAVSRAKERSENSKWSYGQGLGWGAEEDAFVGYRSDDGDDEQALQPFLKEVSRRKGRDQRQQPQSYSYVARCLPDKILGEGLHRIFFRVQCISDSKSSCVNSSFIRQASDLDDIGAGNGVGSIRGSYPPAETFLRDRSPTSRAETLLHQLQSQQRERTQGISFPISAIDDHEDGVLTRRPRQSTVRTAQQGVGSFTAPRRLQREGSRDKESFSSESLFTTPPRRSGPRVGGLQTLRPTHRQQSSEASADSEREVVAGSMLERDEDEDTTPTVATRETRRTQQLRKVTQSSPVAATLESGPAEISPRKTALPPIVSPRVSPRITVTKSDSAPVPSEFTATLTEHAPSRSPRRTLAQQYDPVFSGHNVVVTPAAGSTTAPTSPSPGANIRQQRASTQFKLDLSFIPDE
mmetsp:Transcript_5047/g.7714  ORF Transcript_5047/g.7714 Transcript_5047/m.7714 type:complete len:965 (+) Transcript_5047:214-3108(+)|eukprot:CAMPEP_0185030174 /NCGR_PEP_ID=MMETSP1103-20130426/16967_1 /TAXON_ID=36769 /ORGANISM="Paraphysomonas bandaiensis, Strain Caron Lab Isolate" /LENGTH=964 /DNA_ID=CAMNT_0027565187 /DNA_START=153 /DNA_END=3047 /DNA_ORIENTATION=-